MTSSLGHPIYYQGVPSGFVVSQDTTSTSVSTNAASQSYASESATTFTVTVTTANGEELPASETVTVDVGTADCVATIIPDTGGASGGCSIENGALPVGSYTAVADYGGDTDLTASTSAPTPFNVTTTATIDGVTFGGTPSNPTMTVSGSGFGTESDLGTAYPAACSATGSDYGSNITFSDNTSEWEAGLGTGGGGDCIGLIISSYSNTQITYNFGNGYVEYAGPINDGDSFTMSVLGATFNGTASLGTGYSVHHHRRLGDHQLPGGDVGVPGPACHHRRRGDLLHGPGRPGHHPGLGHQPLHRDGGHLAHRGLPDLGRGRADLSGRFGQWRRRPRTPSRPRPTTCPRATPPWWPAPPTPTTPPTTR